MVSTTQQELKNLLSRQLISAHTKCITALVTAGLCSLITPLHQWDIPYVKGKYENELVNLIAFISSCSLCSYAFCKADKVREYGGKLQMFNQLEKERFIQEQLLVQEVYLQQLRYQYQPTNYQEQNYPLELPLHTTTGSVVNGTHSDTQESHASLQSTTLQSDKFILSCPNCGSVNINPNGSVRGKQRFKCNDCGKTFGVLNHATN